MNARLRLLAWLAGCSFTMALATFGNVPATAQAAAQANSDSWQIPTNAPSEKNPVALTPDVIKKGQQIFKNRCERCHGASGKGNGPEADPDRPPGDLSDPSRAGANPDGVVFYRIWNGRKKPAMPAFKTELSRNDVWTVIHYARTLRK